MPLSGLELETSGFDTMLGFMHQPSEPKSLSDWEEVGNPLILHNTHITIEYCQLLDLFELQHEMGHSNSIYCSYTRNTVPL